MAKFKKHTNRKLSGVDIAPKKDDTWIYVGIGVSVIGLGVAAYFAYRKLQNTDNDMLIVGNSTLELPKNKDIKKVTLPPKQQYATTSYQSPNIQVEAVVAQKDTLTRSQKDELLYDWANDGGITNAQSLSNFNKALKEMSEGEKDTMYIYLRDYILVGKKPAILSKMRGSIAKISKKYNIDKSLSGINDYCPEFDCVTYLIF